VAPRDCASRPSLLFSHIFSIVVPKTSIACYAVERGGRGGEEGTGEKGWISEKARVEHRSGACFARGPASSIDAKAPGIFINAVGKKKEKEGERVAEASSLTPLSRSGALVN